MKEDTRKKVERFFDQYTRGFDLIYEKRRLTDRLFRRVMYLRFEKSIQLLSDPSIKTVLDIGCGTGRYTLALAHLGKYVIAIDVSATMIEFAKARLEAAGLADRVKFIVGDYMEIDVQGDGAVLTGFFDYISEPGAVLSKLRVDIRKLVCMSFPRRWHWLSWQRQIRYWLRGCPLFFYTRRQVEELLKQAGFRFWQIENIGRDLFVSAHV